jgi:hypothetical protein
MNTTRRQLFPRFRILAISASPPSDLSPAEVYFGKHNIPLPSLNSYCFLSTGRRFCETTNQALAESLSLKSNIVRVYRAAASRLSCS